MGEISYRLTDDKDEPLGMSNFAFSIEVNRNYGVDVFNMTLYSEV